MLYKYYKKREQGSKAVFISNIKVNIYNKIFAKGTTPNFD